MAHEIDISDGSMHLASGVVLDHNASLQHLVATGIAVSRDVDMKTGWHLVSIASSLLFEMPANLVLLFFNDELKQIHFTLKQTSITDPDDIRKIHDNTLLREFGVPQVRDAQKLMYVFPWGTMVSARDPRRGQSEVALTWK
jgi:hypothetical protein